MDVCIRKPLIVTCGTDKFVRIWNYEEKFIELSRSFPEEAHCVSIHPSGLYIIIGFPDKIKLMSLIIHNNQMKVFKEIPYKVILFYF